ncbi:hypothetical protein Gogos_010107 [Gossypium gossypioides]|uniref:Uncharacterized protein n=1 Tax=Gossypium gossypioides TaxID=34282 RepID=A0A7J9BKB2_GOSGO|nr:hypothetical protein [Gossypium gossypioides]
MPINRDPSTPPPMIGKIGPYTVFVTPPSTPTPTEPPVFQSPQKAVAPPAPAPPPVRPPPQQFDKSFVASDSGGSILGFFRNAAFNVQNAHSSLDDHLARWFGLNQSKYQWALDDYYESKGLVTKEAWCPVIIPFLVFNHIYEIKIAYVVNGYVVVDGRETGCTGL